MAKVQPTCGNCKGKHVDTDAVLACYQARWADEAAFEDAAEAERRYEVWLETRHDQYREEVHQDLIACGEPGL